MKNETRSIQNTYLALEIVKIGQYLAEQHSGEPVEFDLVVQIGASLDTAKWRIPLYLAVMILCLPSTAKYGGCTVVRLILLLYPNIFKPKG